MKLYVAAALALCACEPLSLESYVYEPLAEPKGGYQLSTAIIPSFEDVTVETQDGERLHVVFVPSDGQHPEVTLLYFHGQASNIGKSWSRIELLYPLGVNLVAVDPRGYGRSTGTPSEAGVGIDVIAVWDAMIARGLDDSNFVIYGRSLGAAFATELAVQKRARAHITESAFTSIQALVSEAAYVDLPASTLVKSRWDNLDKMARVAEPYLAMHGLADDYVPYAHSEKLAAAHDGVTEIVLVPNANHGTDRGPPVVLGDDYVPLLRRFLGL